MELFEGGGEIIMNIKLALKEKYLVSQCVYLKVWSATTYYVPERVFESVAKFAMSSILFCGRSMRNHPSETKLATSSPTQLNLSPLL